MDKLELSSAFKQTTVCCFTLFGLSIFMLTATSQEAEAQSRAAQCRALNAQLASLSSGGSSGGNSKKYRQYDNAVRSQQIQITKTKRIAKRGRCTGLGLFNSKSAQCRRIISSLKKMEANLRSLKNTRAKFAPRQSGNARKRNKILRRMDQIGCNTSNSQQVASQQPRKSKRRTLLEQIFGVRTYGDNGQRLNDEEINPTYSGFGTYRTLCVRKTDGYYFPISFSTVQERFEYDQETCQAMCPSAAVELYYHKMPTEDSEEMVNYRTGVPYANEPFAFAYRKSVNLEQKCRFATENRIQGVEIASKELSQKPISKRIGTPVFRQDPALSPDDHDIKHGGLTLAKAKEYLVNKRSSKDDKNVQVLAENRKIRIVGPAFFPVQ